MRFTYAETFCDPDLPGAAGPGGGGGRVRLVLGARQPDLPGRVRRPLPLHGRRRPRVPRGQADHRAVRPDPLAGGGDRAHPVHDVRAQGAGAACGAAGQAGGQRGRADRQPAAARRRHQPVARGLRGDGPAVGAARRPPRRDDRRSCAGLTGRRLVRAPRRAHRRRADEDLPGADRADPDPRRRPRRPGAAAGGDARRRLGPRRRRPRRAARPARPRWPSCGARRGGPASRSRST